jgi:hypothetical protein
MRIFSLSIYIFSLYYFTVLMHLVDALAQRKRMQTTNKIIRVIINKVKEKRKKAFNKKKLAKR